MKEDEKNSLGCLPVAYQSIEFEDRAINELKIISTKKRWQIFIRFKSLPSYLRGLTLRYTPNTQLKKFYLKYKYRGKEEERQETIITWDEPVIKDPGADYKPGKFKFLDEQIKNSKKS